MGGTMALAPRRRASSDAWLIVLVASASLSTCSCFSPAFMPAALSKLQASPARLSLSNVAERGSTIPSAAFPLRKSSAPALKMGLFDSIKQKVGIQTPGLDSKQVSEENRQLVAAYQARVEEKINALEDTIETLSDDQLKAKTAEFRSRLKAPEIRWLSGCTGIRCEKVATGHTTDDDFIIMVQGGESLDDILDEAFAVVREASWRVLQLRHYDVQMVGGMALHDARLAEMATGEGKTLVASLASYLNALEGKGVHVVTVNDYLARRDSENIGQIHKFLGMSVGLIQADMKPEERQKNYACDITYVTNSELGFDYLRDQLAMNPEGMVLGRPLNMCIVDEADSIMIDEARTPLIISEKTAAPVAKYSNSAKIAAVLEEKVHYTVDERSQSVVLTERGFADVEKILNVDDLFNPRDPWSPYIINALKAKSLFKKDVQYVKRNNEIMIVDEFTGRVLEGRRWSNGLHQSVEAKEGLSPTAETQTIASITYQSFFRLFPKLSGMSGTASTEAKEFNDIYNLGVVSIPTALPVARRDNADVCFRTQAGKWEAVMGDIARRHTKGQPILVGTTSVQASEQLSQLLSELKVPHELLNAKPENVDRESEIVAQAGRAYAITLSTNMAGRGTDILLGGNSGFFARKRLMQKLAPALLDKKSGLPSKSELEIKENPACVPLPELSGEAVAAIDAAAAAAKKDVGSARNMLEVEQMIAVAAETGPVEAGYLEEIRKAYKMVKGEIDVQCKKEQEEVIKLGGLHVIGTERHESRRIDQQLRGRAGRQGDPGSSRFFLALDDNIFRIFGGSSIDGLLKTLRVEENMPLEAKSVQNSLDKVQQSVEEYFFGIRKEMFKYDEILSTQRDALYTIRRKLVLADADNLSEQMLEYCHETADEIAPNYIRKGQMDFAGLVNKLNQFFEGIEVSEDVLKSKGSEENIIAYLREQVLEVLEKKEEGLESVKDGFAFDIERYITLTQVDNLWKQHLKDMDYLKEFVGLRAYKQGDPFQEYQQEGYELFQDMLAQIRRNTVYSFFQYKLQNAENKEKAAAGAGKKSKKKSKK